MRIGEVFHLCYFCLLFYGFFDTRKHKFFLDKTQKFKAKLDFAFMRKTILI